MPDPEEKVAWLFSALFLDIFSEYYKNLFHQLSFTNFLLIIKEV